MDTSQILFYHPAVKKGEKHKKKNNSININDIDLVLF